MPNRAGVRACADCGRDMRPAGTTADEYPMTISYGRAGSCTTCVARVNRGTTRTHDDPSTDRLWAGKPMQLVRWRNTSEGWVYDLIKGQYGGLVDGNFRVIVGGSEELLPRGEWEVCAA